MKTLLTTSFALALLGGLILTGGCSGSEADQLRAQNARQYDQLTATQAALEALRRDKTQLQAQLRDAHLALEAANSKYATLDEAHRKLLEDYKNLQLAMQDKGPIKPPIAQGPLPVSMNKAMKELADKFGLIYDAERGMVKLPNDLTFEKGSDAISANGKAILKKFSEIVKMPEAAGFNVYIAGHTDDIPIKKGGPTYERHPTNFYLSAHRALSVQEELVTDGYAAGKIGAMGFGEFHPIAPNAAGNHGNQANRRVELWIVPPERFLTLPMEGVEPGAPAVSPATTTRPTRTASIR